MAKDSSSNRAHMRERIAQLAARLIAEDGINDYALAKRKAARQLGADDSQNVPNNREIEQALKAHHTLFAGADHPARLKDLRAEALRVMDVFAAFNPHLAGSVLNGTAGRYAAIELVLFTDEVKDLEFFLINQGIPFKSGERRGARATSLPSYSLLTEFPVNLTVRDRAAQRNIRAEAELADRAALEALIATES